VIVMSGAADQEDRERAIQEGAVAFYKLPIVSVDKILEAVEAAAGAVEASR
jgi:CheY-like chemotaxis protein